MPVSKQVSFGSDGVANNIPAPIDRSVHSQKCVGHGSSVPKCSKYVSAHASDDVIHVDDDLDIDRECDAFVSPNHYVGVSFFMLLDFFHS